MGENSPLHLLNAEVMHCWEVLDVFHMKKRKRKTLPFLSSSPVIEKSFTLHNYFSHISFIYFSKTLPPVRFLIARDIVEKNFWSYLIRIEEIYSWKEFEGKVFKRMWFCIFLLFTVYFHLPKSKERRLFVSAMRFIPFTMDNKLPLQSCSQVP